MDTSSFLYRKAALSNNNIRIVGRAIPIACLVVITCAQALFDSKATPDGIYLTFPIALIYGLGFALIAYLLSVFILIFLEFPLNDYFRFYFYHTYHMIKYFLNGIKIKYKNALI